MHHQSNGHEPGQTQGDGEGQGSLLCCSPWGREERDTTGQLNSNSKYSKQTFSKQTVNQINKSIFSLCLIFSATFSTL